MILISFMKKFEQRIVEVTNELDILGMGGMSCEAEREYGGKIVNRSIQLSPLSLQNSSAL